MKKFDYKAKTKATVMTIAKKAGRQAHIIMIVPVLLLPYSKLLFAVYEMKELFLCLALPSSYFHLRGGRQRHKLPFFLIYPFSSH